MDTAPAHVGELQHRDQGVQEFRMYRNNPAAAALALSDPDSGLVGSPGKVARSSLLRVVSVFFNTLVILGGAL